MRCFCAAVLLVSLLALAADDALALPPPPPAESPLVQLIARGDAALRGGDSISAIGFYRDAVTRAPRDARGYTALMLGLSAGALFTGIVATLGAYFVWENGAHHFFFSLLGQSLDGLPEGPTTPDLEWPTWMVYSAIPLGTSLMCFRFLQVLAGFLKTGELPHHDHGHVDGLEDNLHPADLHTSQGTAK